MWTRLKRLGLTLKKCLIASEQARADVAATRRLWEWLKAALDAGRLVFANETWTKTTMARLYGHAPRGQRLIGRVPWAHWHTTTLVAEPGREAATGSGMLTCSTVNGETAWSGGTQEHPRAMAKTHTGRG